MKARILFLALTAATMLTGCSASSAFTGNTIPTSSGTGGPNGSYIYAGKIASTSKGAIEAAEIYSFPATSSGSSTAPTSTLAGPASTFLSMIRGDGNGDIYALYGGFLGPSVTVQEYSAALNGILTPTRSFSYITNESVSSMAADKNGNVYLGLENSTILAFGPTASGITTASFTYSGLNGWTMTTDNSGNLYVGANGDSSSTISVLSAGFSPTSKAGRTITCAGFYVTDLAVDSTGNIYALGQTAISNMPEILVFSPNASGVSIPSRVISGMNFAENIAVSSAGALYLLESPPNAGFNTYIEFPSSANGSVVPTASFTDPTTYQAVVRGLVVY